MTTACFINPPRFAGNNNFTVSGVDFADTNWLERDADLGSLSDGTQFSFSMWIDPDTVASTQNLYSTGNNQILISISSTGQFIVSGEDTGGTAVIAFRSPAASVTTGWQHWIGSFDTGNATRMWLRKDATSQTLSSTLNAGTSAVVDWTQADHAIAANPGAGGVSYDGGMAELWIAHNVWIDNTDANVLKFISQLNVNGTPVDLGATGTNPGLGTPTIWLTRRSSGSVADFISNNNATSGGFTSKGTPAISDRGVVT